MSQRFGDYELIRHIATGGMAEIFLARHSVGLDRVLIIKRMLPELAVRPDFVQMFLDEGRLTASLQHPHVVRVHDMGQVEGSYFIAMELVDGPHLGALFAHSLRARKPLPIELCVWIIARAADGLEYAHTLSAPSTGKPLNLVHRDISPQNILVSRTGEVKVTDFGVAKASTQQTKTRTGIVKGKVSYMSPEQCLGEVVDHRTDVFALGVVLYELLTRRRLFREKSDLLVMQRITNEEVAAPSSVNPAIDSTLDGIVAHALHKGLDGRFQTAADFADALDGWLHKAGRPADELALATWFAEHCPELAPTATAEGPVEATVAVPFSPPGALGDAPTSLTPSFSTRGAPRESMRLPASIGDPLAVSDVEATRVASQPSFPSEDDSATNRLPLKTSLADAADVAASNSTVHGDAENSGAENDNPPSSTLTAPAPVAPGSRSPPSSSSAPLIAAAVAALVVLVAVVGVGVSAGAGASNEPTPQVSVPTPATTTTPPPETPAPPTTTTTTLVVETIPGDVPILVGDRVVGRSPIEIVQPAGDVIVQAQFPEQPVQRREVTLPEGETTKVVFSAKVPLIIRTTPTGAAVRIGGELLGETPFERGYLVEPDSPQHLQLEPPAGYAVIEKDIVAKAGEPLVLEYTFAREQQRRPERVVATRMGALSMRTDPWTFVSVSRERFGETPFAEKPLKAGRHVLKVTNPELGLDDQLPVTITKDKTLVVILKYEKGPTGWKVRSKTVR
jgi:serine/threonine-protein kinase